TITNDGSDSLAVTSIASDSEAFTPSADAVIVPARTSLSLTVRFSPPNAGTSEGTLTLTSNDPQNGELSISLLVEGVPRPALVLSPPSFRVSLLTGQSTVRTLKILNDGASDVDWSVALTLRKTTSLPRDANRSVPFPG